MFPLPLPGGIGATKVDVSLLTGDSLRNILRGQVEKPELRDASGRLVRQISVRDALLIAESGRYAGVGNGRRIRYLRPLVSPASVLGNAGSRTTRRPRIDGILYAPAWVREHKPL